MMLSRRMLGRSVVVEEMVSMLSRRMLGRSVVVEETVSMLSRRMLGRSVVVEETVSWRGCCLCPRILSVVKETASCRGGCRLEKSLPVAEDVVSHKGFQLPRRVADFVDVVKDADVAETARRLPELSRVLPRWQVWLSLCEECCQLPIRYSSHRGGC